MKKDNDKKTKGKSRVHHKLTKSPKLRSDRKNTDWLYEALGWDKNE